MKTVKFKDLPEKVQTFLYENQHSLGYFCPENDIQLNWLHNISIWDKATDEERLAYAEWRYKFGVRLKDAYDDEEYDLKLRSTIFYLEKDPRSPHDIMLTRNERHTDITIYDSDKKKWAEIIEEPEKEDVEMNASIKRDVEQVLAEDSEPTFKAGDEVEVSHNGLIYNDENYFFTGGTTAKGLYICEGASKNGALYAFQHIRKPDPDKIYRAIAKEMMTKEGIGDIVWYTHVGISLDKIESMLIEALIEALKKGKGL